MATNKTVTVTTAPTKTGDTLASYKIYTNQSGTALATITPAQGLSGYVVSLTDGLNHSITVKAVWTTGGESTLSSNTVSVNLAMAAPTNIVLTETGTNYVTITWTDPSPTTNVDHLEIWRKTGVGGTYAQIGSDISLAAANSYEDTNGGTGLTDGTTYYYQVRAYAADGTTYEEVEGNITISAASSSILFQDDFTGTTIDTAKWTVTNPSAGVVISQNNAMLFTSDGVTTPGNDNASSVLFASGNKVLIFDLSMNNQGIGGYWSISITNDIDYIIISRTNTSSQTSIRQNIVINLSTVLETTQVLDLNTVKTMKIAYIDGISTISYWSGSAWVVTATHTGAFTTTTDFRIDLIFGGTTTPRVASVDNVYVISEDITTQYPV